VAQAVRVQVPPSAPFRKTKKYSHESVSIFYIQVIKLLI